MAEKWQTPRKCHPCFLKRVISHLWAQYWGSGQFRLCCERCGHSEIADWAGQLDSGEYQK